MLQKPTPFLVVPGSKLRAWSMNDQPLSHIPGLNTLKIYQNVTTGLQYPDCSAGSATTLQGQSTYSCPLCEPPIRASYANCGKRFRANSFVCPPPFSFLSFFFLLLLFLLLKWWEIQCRALCMWAASFRPALHPSPRPLHTCL